MSAGALPEAKSCGKISLVQLLVYTAHSTQYTVILVYTAHSTQ